MVKLGLDFHGVFNKYPRYFKKLIEDNDIEIHIITGSSMRNFDIQLKQLEKDIELKLDIYDYFFSIEDFLIEKGFEFKIDNKDGKMFDKEKWNIAKGFYCERNEIDLHIDDTKIYEKYFFTEFHYLTDYAEMVKHIELLMES